MVSDLREQLTATVQAWKDGFPVKTSGTAKPITSEQLDAVIAYGDRPIRDVAETLIELSRLIQDIRSLEPVIDSHLRLHGIVSRVRRRS